MKLFLLVTTAVAFVALAIDAIPVSRKFVVVSDDGSDHLDNGDYLAERAEAGANL